LNFKKHKNMPRLRERNGQKPLHKPDTMGGMKVSALLY